MTEYKTEYKKKENTLLDHNFLKRGKEKRRERERELPWPPKAMAPPMYKCSLILGYLKLCSRGASAGRASER